MSFSCNEIKIENTNKNHEKVKAKMIMTWIKPSVLKWLYKNHHTILSFILKFQINRTKSKLKTLCRSRVCAMPHLVILSALNLFYNNETVGCVSSITC